MKHFNIYLILILVLDPILSILRQVQIYNTAQFVVLYGVLVFIIMLPHAFKKQFVFNDLLIWFFISALVIGTIKGLQNLHTEGFIRNYFADTFNLIKAMFAYHLGMIMYSNPFELPKPTKRIINTSIAVCTLVTVFLVYAVNAGYVQYLDGPGYTLLLPYVVYINSNPYLTSLILSLVLLSTKRGAIVMAISLLLTALVLGSFKRKQFKNAKPYFKGILFLFFLSIPFLQSAWVQKQVKTVADIFEYKVLNLSELNSLDRYQLDNLGGGRISEVESAIKAMGAHDWLLGGGHGFSYHIKDYVETESTHNVHFTPLSIVTRYGLLITAFFYIVIIILITKIIYTVYKNKNPQPIIIPLLYIIGALIYSFFAYSLMNDVIFMFMLGHLSVYAKEIRREVSNTFPALSN